jgi:hypothetical protein
MATRVDDLNGRYLVPGIATEPTAAVDVEGLEHDSVPEPYSQPQELGSLPTESGWQDMLGLNRIAPDPTQIGRPPRPLANASQSSEGSGSGDATTSKRQVAMSSPAVQRMLGMLDGHERLTRSMRARAAMAGGR